MRIERLDHINIRTAQLEQMVTWYTTRLCLDEGYRPNFKSTGAWLYAGTAAVVHLLEVDEPVGVGSEQILKLQRFTLAASNSVEFEARFKELNQKYTLNTVGPLGVVILEVQDPDGNYIHLNFSADRTLHEK